MTGYKTQLPKEALEQLLLDNLVLEKKELDLLKKEAKRSQKPLSKLLFEKNFISEKHLTKLIAEHLKIPFIDLSLVKIKASIRESIPETICREKKVIPFFREKNNLYLAMADPRNVRTISLIKALTRLKVVPCLASEKSINRILKSGGNTQERFKKLAENGFKSITQKSYQNKKKIAEIVNTIIELAIFARASEIIIEELDGSTLVCFKIDGIIREVVKFPKEFFYFIFSDLGKKAGVSASQKDFRSAFYYQIGQEKIFLPISATTLFLKKIKIIVPQDEYQESGLMELGLAPHFITRFKRILEKPDGIIIVAGPKHSGRTTFIYTILRMLNEERKSIYTLENPVRESIRRITQTDQGFFNDISEREILTSFLKAKPNVIVAEDLFDSEAFEEITNFSLLGNLAILKVEAKDSFEALLHLLNLFQEKRLSALGLRYIIAEKLVRKICPFCASEENPSQELFNKLQKAALKEDIDLKKFLREGINPAPFGRFLLKNSKCQKHLSAKRCGIKFYSGKGCRECYYTGFQGQLGIFEVLEINEEIKNMLNSGESFSYMKKKAKENGFTSFFEDALQKARQGKTSLKEIIRVFN